MADRSNTPGEGSKPGRVHARIEIVLPPNATIEQAEAIEAYFTEQMRQVAAEDPTFRGVIFREDDHKPPPGEKGGTEK